MRKKAINRLTDAGARAFGFIATIPFRFRTNRISRPRVVPHDGWLDFLAEKFNKEGVRILEIGARNVTGDNVRRRFANADYTGFDFYAGENVDVVGDVHKLSTYFAGQRRFDLI